MTGETGNGIGHKKIEQDWYEIEVEGHINPGWFDWLDGWKITPLTSGSTLLSGRIIDQSALHGIFACVRDLNLKIISLKKSACPQSDETQGLKEQELKR